MDTGRNKEIVREFMEKAFNEGDLAQVDATLAEGAVDHQEPPGTPFAPHLKQVIQGMRATFPDLHFEIRDLIAEGDLVAFRSTMTGTHQGVSNIGPFPPVPPTGRRVSVEHMHFVRMVDGKTTDLWHVWDTAGLLRQMGVIPAPQPQR